MTHEEIIAKLKSAHKLLCQRDECEGVEFEDEVEAINLAIAALESEPLAVDAGPLWFDHLGFPHLLGQYITVPLRGEWVAGLDGGTQLGVTITERTDA